jgi:hypothetical protein
MTIFGGKADALRILCDTCLNARDRAEPGGCPSQKDRGDPDCGDKESCAADARLRRPCFFSHTEDVRGRSNLSPRDPIRDDLQMLFGGGGRRKVYESWVIERPSHLPADNTNRPTEEEQESKVIELEGDSDV